MSSKEIKAWQAPKLETFNNVEEAVNYYTERGMHEHVAAVKRLASDKETKGDPRPKTSSSVGGT